MNILITGGSGFVGSHLSRHFLDQGHAVTGLGTRAVFKGFARRSNFNYLQADTTRPGSWQQAVQSADLIINLAGKTIFHRWSERYKQQIQASRILTTRNIVTALPSHSRAVLISASAVGYYGSCADAELNEESPAGEDFLAKVAVLWEDEALKAVRSGARVIRVRFGIVLGADGGALVSMLPAFKSFVGGPLGSGNQWFPWIHIQDVIAALDFLFSRPELEGAFNLCAPYPVRNKEMALTLGRILERPAKIPVPAFMLKLAAGELATVLLASTRALPAKLLASGFKFRYPHLTEALENFLQTKSA
jgi:hypothetical protein